jgi:hypothetical protein
MPRFILDHFVSQLDRFHAARNGTQSALFMKLA